MASYSVSKILMSLLISVSVVTSQEIPAASPIHRDSKFLFSSHFRNFFKFPSSFFSKILICFFLYPSFSFYSFLSLDNRVGGIIQDLSGSSSKSCDWRGFGFRKCPSFFIVEKIQNQILMLH